MLKTTILYKVLKLMLFVFQNTPEGLSSSGFPKLFFKGFFK